MSLFQETAESVSSSVSLILFPGFSRPAPLVVLIIYALDAVADAGEHLVRDGIKGIA